MQLVYTDVWGPTQKSIGCLAYYIIFVDFYSKYASFYPIKEKSKENSDVAKLFPIVKHLVEKYFQTPLILIFSKNGGKYQSLIPMFESIGVSHFTTPPHTPE